MAVTTTTTTTTTTVPVEPTEPVSLDFNGDGEVTIADAVIMTRMLTEDFTAEDAPTAEEIWHCDLNQDGIVDLFDVRLMTAAFKHESLASSK